MKDKDKKLVGLVRLLAQFEVPLLGFYQGNNPLGFRPFDNKMICEKAASAIVTFFEKFEPKAEAKPELDYTPAPTNQPGATDAPQP